ncbi:MAG TPA: plastocyanin/azurin family copper-binding protein [Solirubrobacteraceae bacterium]
MRLRKRYLPAAALLGLAVAVLPAVASSEEASQPVEAVNEGGGLYGEETHRWSPAQTAVTAVGVVTFSNSTAVPHGVEWRSAIKPSCEEGPGKVPVGTTEAASGTKWSGKCTFSQPGTYLFWCTVHHAAMAGTITVNAGGTTTTTTTTSTPTTNGTTTIPLAETPPASPLVGTPSLRSRQHGTSVRGSLDVSPAGVGDRLEVDLFAGSASLAKAKHTVRVRIGRFIRNSVPAGGQSFVVTLDGKAKRALKRHHRLALTVKITLVPFHGAATTLTRIVVMHPQ